MVSFGGGGNAVDSLTLKEVEEAKTYGLSNNQYVRIRETFEMRLRDKLRDLVKKEVYSSAEKELRKTIRQEVETEIRASFEEKLGTDLRAKVRAELEAEAQKLTPNQKERTTAKEFIREVELDSLTQAHAASGIADETEVYLASARKVRSPLFYASLISFIPTLLYLNMAKGWDFSHANLWAAMGTMVVAFITICVSNDAAYTRAKNVIDSHRKVSSDYWVLAEFAKKARMVETDAAASRSELANLTEKVSTLKANLDHHFHPSAVRVEKSRVAVKEQLITDMDPEKLLRVDASAFDEALEESSEQSETRQSRGA